MSSRISLLNFLFVSVLLLSPLPSSPCPLPLPATLLPSQFRFPFPPPQSLAAPSLRPPSTPRERDSPPPPSPVHAHGAWTCRWERGGGARGVTLKLPPRSLVLFRRGLIGASEAVEQVLQNKLATAPEISTEERQQVTTREVVRGPHRDKEQREHLTEIATLQIALTVLRRPPGECDKGPEEQPRARDGARRKTQSWAEMRSLDMIAPEVTNPAVLHMLPSSNLDLVISHWLKRVEACPSTLLSSRVEACPSTLLSSRFVCFLRGEASRSGGGGGHCLSLSPVTSLDSCRHFVLRLLLLLLLLLLRLLECGGHARCRTRGCR